MDAPLTSFCAGGANGAEMVRRSSRQKPCQAGFAAYVSR